MAPLRTHRQLCFDTWTEDVDFRPEVEYLITDHFGGLIMHVDRVTLRNRKTITPTNVPWPDLTIWFPDRTADAAATWGLRVTHLMELKTHDNPALRGGQPTLFLSLEQAGQPVVVVEPRDLDGTVMDWLESWSGVARPPGLFVPKARRLARPLAGVPV